MAVADAAAAMSRLRSYYAGGEVKAPRLWALAERIAARLLGAFAMAGLSEVVIRVRKPNVALPGPLDAASVEIRRRPAETR